MTMGHFCKLSEISLFDDNGSFLKTFRDTSGDNSSDQSSLSFPDIPMNNEETFDWFETAADQVFFPL